MNDGMIDDAIINVVDEDEEYPAIARLIELGRQKSYVTIDDVLHFFPMQNTMSNSSRKLSRH